MNGAKIFQGGGVGHVHNNGNIVFYCVDTNSILGALRLGIDFLILVYKYESISMFVSMSICIQLSDILQAWFRIRCSYHFVFFFKKTVKIRFVVDLYLDSEFDFDHAFICYVDSIVDIVFDLFFLLRVPF